MLTTAVVFSHGDSREAGGPIFTVDRSASLSLKAAFEMVIERGFQPG